MVLRNITLREGKQMTKKEAARQNQQEATLVNLGFNPVEAEALRRISLTLRRWFEHERNGAIQRDGDDGEGKPFWYNTNTGRKIGPVPDREAGAMKRLNAIIAMRNARAIAEASKALTDDRQAPPMDFAPHTLKYYIQSDPRGASLYIIRPGDVPNGADVHGYYTRGIVVY